MIRPRAAPEFGGACLSRQMMVPDQQKILLQKIMLKSAAILSSRHLPIPNLKIPSLCISRRLLSP